MNIGDAVKVCRPCIHGDGGLAILDCDWFPATIASINADTITVVFADFTRQEFSTRQSAYVIRSAQ